MRNVNRCRRCGAKYANKDEAIWHFWSEHRDFLFRRIFYAGVIGGILGFLLLMAVGMLGGF